MPAGASRDSAGSSRASAHLVPLPTNLSDPTSRVAALVEARREADAHAPSLERSRGWLQFAEAAGHTILGLGVELRRWLHSFNLIVSVLPGPEASRYMVGSKLIAAYPQIPLFQNQGLSVGVASYGGQLHIGLVADWEILPDLVLLISDLKTAYEEIVATT